MINISITMVKRQKQNCSVQSGNNATEKKAGATKGETGEIIDFQDSDYSSLVPLCRHFQGVHWIVIRLYIHHPSPIESSKFLRFLSDQSILDWVGVERGGEV